jgi:hypothetical protein
MWKCLHVKYSLRFQWNCTFLGGFSGRGGGGGPKNQNKKKTDQWEPSCSVRTDERTCRSKESPFANAPKIALQLTLLLHVWNMARCSVLPHSYNTQSSTENSLHRGAGEPYGRNSVLSRTARAWHCRAVPAVALMFQDQKQSKKYYYYYYYTVLYLRRYNASVSLGQDTAR